MDRSDEKWKIRNWKIGNTDLNDVEMKKEYSIQKRKCNGKHQPASHCCIRSCAAGVKRQSSSTVCRLPATLNSRWWTPDSSWNTRRRDSVIRFPRPRQVEILLPSGTFKWGFLPCHFLQHEARIPTHHRKKLERWVRLLRGPFSSWCWDED